MSRTSGIKEQLLAPPTLRESLLVIALGGLTIAALRSRKQRKIDRLTGLLTYEAFHAQAIRATAYARRKGDRDRRHGVLFLDFDDFKDLNTSLGHPAVNKHVLRPAANAMRQATRSDDGTDTICRYGGEEFAALVMDVDDDAGLMVAAQRLQTGINEVNPYAHKGGFGRLGVSIGCALLTQGESFDQALVRANQAMLAAKEIEGKNQILIAPDA